MNTQEAIKELENVIKWHSDIHDQGVEALTHAIEHMKRGQWQPIESAPIDVDVLLYCPEIHATNPERVEVGYYKNTKSGSMQDRKSTRLNSSH